MLRASLLISFTCSLLLAAPAFAQDAATGAIHGKVLDPAVAHIAQASIVAAPAPAARAPPPPDAEGRSPMGLLPPGASSARAVAQGMSPPVTPPLHVDV